MADLLPDHREPRVLVVLLEAIGDRQPAPRAPRWERDGTAGMVASRWTICPTCTAGRTKRGGIWTACQRCRGTGGWFSDPYDEAGRRVDPQADRIDVTIADVVRQLCDLSLRELERLHPDQPDPRDPTTPQWLAGIEAGLRKMRSAPALMLCAFYVTAVPTPTSPDQLDAAVVELSETIDRRFRAPTWARQRATTVDRLPRGRGRHALNDTQRAARDREIRRLRDAGWKAPAIGRRLGVSTRTVERLTKPSGRSSTVRSDVACDIPPYPADRPVNLRQAS